MGNGFTLGIVGLWNGVYDAAREFANALSAICKVSTLHNAAHVIAWAIMLVAMLMILPKLAQNVNGLLNKTLPHEVWPGWWRRGDGQDGGNAKPST